MHVLHVTEAHGGGVQSAISHFVRQTPGLRHTLLARSRAGEETVTAEDLEVVPIQGNLTAFLREARARIIELHPDVVHLHSSFAGLLRAFLPSDVPRVYSPHCFAFERMDVSAAGRGVYRLTERLLMRRTDAVIAVSPYEQALSRALRSGVRVDVASNFAPLDVVPATLSARSARVVTVGRICAQKDPDFFASVASHPVVAGAGLRFEWVGDGEASLKAKLLRAGVTVTGWLGHSEVSTNLSHGGLYLHTARWEASPMSLAEALNVDLPILCRQLATLESLGYADAGATVTEVATSVVRFFQDDAVRRSVVSRNAVTRRMMTESGAGQVLPASYAAAIAARSGGTGR